MDLNVHSLGVSSIQALSEPVWVLVDSIRLDRLPGCCSVSSGYLDYAYVGSLHTPRTRKSSCVDILEAGVNLIEIVLIA